jgi:chaperonin GroES
LSFEDPFRKEPTEGGGEWGPCFDFLLVEPLEAPETTKGGIHLPDSFKRKAFEGTITKIGPDVTAFKVGQYIGFSDYSGEPLKVQGKDMLLIRQASVLCIKK